MTARLRQDDLKPGQWIVLTGCLRGNPAVLDDFELMNAERDENFYWTISGVPLLVAAVSLPFIIVNSRPSKSKPYHVHENGEHEYRPGVFTVDTRLFTIQKVDRKYAAPWWREFLPPTEHEKRKQREWERVQDDIALQDAREELTKKTKPERPGFRGMIYPPRKTGF